MLSSRNLPTRHDLGEKDGFWKKQLNVRVLLASADNATLLVKNVSCNEINSWSGVFVCEKASLRDKD